MIGGLRRLIPILLLALAPALTGCGGGKKAPAEAAPPPPSTQTQAQSATTAGGCQRVQPPPPRNPGGEKKPKHPLDSSKKWSLTFKTNCGAFTVALNLRTAPKASASLVALARSGYFDKTVFHRIAPGFVIQGGDPTATGNGDPGYKTVDQPPAGARYTHGVVAMAKTPSEAPGTAGSQFFVVTGPDAGLPPDYAVLGTVTKGLGVVDRIGKLGNQAEQPTELVMIRGVGVSSR
jgi:peptidyl-prolyl cis-trans isomerase B (cyclophilin B)